MKDLNSQVKISSAIDPAAIFAGNGTKTSAIIDTKDYDSLEFAVISGALTDADYTTTMYESNDSGMSGEAAVADADIIGTESVFALAEDSTVKKFGYKGNMRYVRIKIVQTNATTGGYMCAIAIQGHAHVLPVA